MLAALAGSAATALIGGCGRSRTRLKFSATLLIDTPSGQRAGTSVLEAVSTSPSTVPLPGDLGSLSLLGEAPFFDFGRGQFLFMILEEDDNPRNLIQLLLDGLKSGQSIPPLPSDPSQNPLIQSQAIKPSIALELFQYPRLVTFSDHRSPASVREVAPNGISREFGGGYDLSGIVLQVVDSDIDLTSRIFEVLPWSDAPPERRLISANLLGSMPALAEKLSVRNFVHAGHP